MEPQTIIHKFRSTHSPCLLAQSTNEPVSYPILESQAFSGQIVRIRSRFSKLVFIDLRFPEKPSTPCCKCCSKITLVIKADYLPSGTCTSFKKGKVKLGDKICVVGDLVFADIETGWIDVSQLENGGSERLLEARVQVRSECEMVERFVGRGFEAEMPVHDCECDSQGGQAVVKRNAVEEEGKRICKFWINSGGKHCPLGVKCGFIHVPQEQVVEVRKVWLAERLAKRLENATLEWGDPTPMSEKAPHALRANVFADWIVETFGGAEKLSTGSGVFDIAGGGGQLSLDLFDRGVTRCTVVDSRPFKVGFGLKKWVKKQRKKNQKEVDIVDEEDFDAENDEEELDELEEHDRRSDGHRITSGTEEVAGDNSIVEELPFKYQQLFFTPESVTDEIRNATLLVGLHPDQATGAIVETAIACNLPFAVIPCCVFKDDFNDRILKNGKPVSTTVDLVDWIKEKKPDGQVKTQFLNFQGKNLVVYST
ncbi:UNVERIFIED_CONTAM: hypothetical protein HDU68_002081 [Siphonaria sp. JEL0065]|nr:hypothetical protein HDU68_002081 [Siphonaria sp. JEL0065]